ncbi:MAG: PAS domain S-box protein, partial [Candidatus Omnitrophica bacterium]|nr:PAS domain S-box protein [Candidatus Omnitrophota bacterium]
MGESKITNNKINADVNNSVGSEKKELAAAAVIETMLDGLWIVDIDGRTIDVNPQMGKMLGYKKEELLGKSPVEFFAEEDRPRVIAGIKESIEAGFVKDFEATLVAKDGKKVSITLTASLIKDQQGKPMATYAIFRDITERKKAEEELRRSEEFSKGIIQSSHDCIKVLDTEGRLQFMSDGGQKLLEIEDIKLYINKSWVDFWKGKDHEAAFEAVRKAKSGETGHFQGYCPTVKGTPKWWEIIITPIISKKGKVESLLSISRDITECKEAEEKLEKAEERLIMALSAAEMGTWKWDAVKNQDTRDASFNHMLGLEAKTTTQPVEDFLQRVHPDDRTAVDKDIQQSIREHDVYFAEFRIVCPDGTIRWMRDKGKPFYDEHNKISYMTGAVVDITERKKAEEKNR